MLPLSALYRFEAHNGRAKKAPQVKEPGLYSLVYQYLVPDDKKMPFIYIYMYICI